MRSRSLSRASWSAWSRMGSTWDNNGVARVEVSMGPGLDVSLREEIVKFNSFSFTSPQPDDLPTASAGEILLVNGLSWSLDIARSAG